VEEKGTNLVEEKGTELESQVRSGQDGFIELIFLKLS
jgi:hypothetical protein